VEPSGGKVELEESLEQALRKEVLEETGLTIARFSLFGTFSNPSRMGAYPDGNVVRFIALVNRVEVEDISTLQCSEESLELGWFRRDQLAALDIVPTGRDILEAYMSRDAPFLG
jgi:8-oxo-dGTP pyrophosphatase MutT (NUDIX family)